MAYGTNTGLTDYAASVGKTLTGDPDVARAMGTSYVDGLFWDRLKGTPVDLYGDAWPRTGIEGVDGIPTRVEHATYEAALLWDADNDALSSGAVTNTGSGQVASEQVDVIKISYHAMATSASMANDAVIDNMPRYASIETLMRPFLKSGWSTGVAVFAV